MVPAQLNRSEGGPTSSPESCSGDMYGGVPTTLAEVVVMVMLRAMPKSTTRGPSGPSSTLAGLKSRWTIPAPWIAARAVAVPIASRSRSRAPSGPREPTRCSSDSPR
nr:hypothetical protein GCM10020093_080110 [Planobispora longispora]